MKTLHRSPLKFPEVNIREDALVKVALLLRNEFNRAYTNFQELASNQDIKTFLSVTFILVILSNYTLVSLMVRIAGYGDFVDSLSYGQLVQFFDPLILK